MKTIWQFTALRSFIDQIKPELGYGILPAALLEEETFPLLLILGTLSKELRQAEL